jgi:hypothetical protein
MRIYDICKYVWASGFQMNPPALCNPSLGASITIITYRPFVVVLK